MLIGLATAVRLAGRHPAVANATVAAFVVGAFGGALPTGALASSQGAGLGRGAGWGLWVLAVLSPMIVTYLSVALGAARYEWDLDDDLFLAGQPHAATLGRETITTILTMAALLGSAAIGGAVAGAADSVAQGSSVWTGFPWGALATALIAVCWISFLTTLVVAITKSAVASYCILTGWLFAGVIAVGIVASQAAWDLVGASPVGAFTLVAREVVARPGGFVTHAAVVWVASAIWAFALAWLARRRVRLQSAARRAPAAPAPSR